MDPGNIDRWLFNFSIIHKTKYRVSWKRRDNMLSTTPIKTVLELPREREKERQLYSLSFFHFVMFLSSFIKRVLLILNQLSNRFHVNIGICSTGRYICLFNLEFRVRNLLGHFLDHLFEPSLLFYKSGLLVSRRFDPLLSFRF